MISGRTRRCRMVDDVDVDHPCSSELFGLLRTFFDSTNQEKAREFSYSNSEVMVWCASSISSSNINPSTLHRSRGLVCLREPHTHTSCCRPIVVDVKERTTLYLALLYSGPLRQFVIFALARPFHLGQPLDISTTIIYGYHSLEQREAAAKRLI